jgi:hypothetical protein
VSPEEERRWEEQRLIAELLTRPDGTELDTLAASRLLSASLASVVDDKSFWARLRTADDGEDRQQLALLVQVPWAKVLSAHGYTPPPRAVDVERELVADIGALAKGNDADRLRADLRAFVRRLDNTLASPGHERESWLRRLRHLAGVGLEVLRNVNLASLLWDAAEAAVLSLPVVLPTGPVGYVVAVVAAVTLARFRRVIPQQDADDTSTRVLGQLHNAVAHCDTANKQLKLRERVKRCTTGQVVEGSIANARNLETQVSILLPSAWVYCGAERGAEGRRNIEAIADANATLHRAISAAESTRSLAEVRAAIGTLRDLVRNVAE